MRDLSWMDDIDVVPFLEGDMAIVHHACGPEVLRALWEGVPSMTLYVSTKPINDAKRIYIQRNFDGSNAKELARFLEVSDKFVQEVLSRPMIRKPLPTLFD
ncbi:MAG: hypothetical protein JXK05_03960 [Campylobacterales bacterium]|nr:hypothetical protein [Campylobacterales bacterium]